MHLVCIVTRKSMLFNTSDLSQYIYYTVNNYTIKIDFFQLSPGNFCQVVEAEQDLCDRHGTVGKKI